MRSSIPRLVPWMAVTMMIGGACVLGTMAPVVGLPSGIVYGLCMPLVFWYVSVNRRYEEPGVNRSPNTVARRTTPRQQVRPEHHPLWDRWLDE